MRLKNGEVLFIWPLVLHILTAGWTYNDGSASSGTQRPQPHRQPDRPVQRRKR